MLLVRLPVNSRLLVVNLEGSRKLNSISDCVAAAGGGGGGAGAPDPAVFEGPLCPAIYRRDLSVL